MPKELTPRQKQIVADYVQLVKRLGHYPSRAEMSDIGLGRNAVRQHFISYGKLKAVVRHLHPGLLEDVVEDVAIDAKYIQDNAAYFRSQKRLVLTTSVCDFEVHEKALASIKSYAKLNNAGIGIFPVLSPGAWGTLQDEGVLTVQPQLKDMHIVLTDVRLNSNLFLSSIKLSAKQIDSTTGLLRVVRREGSFIYGSPKQRLKVAATGEKYPHVGMTTGSINTPGYTHKHYLSARTAYIAAHDHVMGAVIVEVEDNRTFHYRQIQFDRDGRFADMGKAYWPDGKVTVFTPAVISLGDWHSGDTDPVVKAATYRLIDEVGVKVAVVHDIFNGHSINHHEKYSQFSKTARVDSDRSLLKDELKCVANELNGLLEHVDYVVVSKSNHDEWLYNWLDQHEYIDDSYNTKLAHELACEVWKGKDPLRVGVERFGLKHPNRVRWLKADQPYKVAGIELGAHGHRGSNGARGTLAGMELAYGSCVTGHSHTPEILRQAWRNGTATGRVEYAKGPSSWMNTHTLVYPNGMRQQINIIRGRYRL